jgi:hypothetical protein
MSSKNDDMTGIGAVGAVFGLVGLFFFAVLAFLVLLLTIAALIALFRPIRIGTLTMSSEEAERFLGWSMAGAIILPVFAAFCEWFFTFQIRENLWFYIVVAGYVLGAMAMAANEEEEKKAAAPRPVPPVLPQPPVQQPAPPRALPRPQGQPFHFARWDDEEARR